MYNDQRANSRLKRFPFGEWNQLTRRLKIPNLARSNEQGYALHGKRYGLTNLHLEMQ